jgi:hypothetical protein
MANRSRIIGDWVLPAVAAFALAAGVSGCRLAADLLPRTHTTAVSPDGRYTAFVHQELNPDPPDDHLYLGPSGGAARRLMDLAPDSDWCRTIVWSSDSRLVGFLVRDQRLAVFEAATGRRIAEVTLVVADGYPGSQAARHVVLHPNGEISFERFEFSSGRALDTETAMIPGR